MSLQTVINSVDNLLSVTAMDHYAKVRHPLWATLNEEINLPNCDIYSYTPDLTSDPFAEDGCLWSFNYFFYNRKLKRVVLLTCRALSPFTSGQSWYDNLPREEEIDFEDWALVMSDILLSFFQLILLSKQKQRKYDCKTSWLYHFQKCTILNYSFSHPLKMLN